MEWWRVEVSDHRGLIVVIEPESLCGRDIGDDEKEKICAAIRNLQGFIGSPTLDKDQIRGLD